MAIAMMTREDMTTRYIKGLLREKPSKLAPHEEVIVKNYINEVSKNILKTIHRTY